MKEFNPAKDIEDSHLILDHGKWPNFHEAKVHNLTICRDDGWPDENVWIGPVIEISFELCKLKQPYIAVLKFHDCSTIRMEGLSNPNGIHDLTLKFEARGTDLDGDPLSPHIATSFENVFGVSLNFKCLRVQAIERKDIKNVA